MSVRKPPPDIWEMGNKFCLSRSMDDLNCNPVFIRDEPGFVSQSHGGDTGLWFHLPFYLDVLEIRTLPLRRTGD